MHEVIGNLFEQHVKGSLPGAVITDKTILLCKLTNTVHKEIMKVCLVDNIDQKVYINSRMVKHLFDKKPAEEFHFLVNNAHKIVKYPDKIYKNKNPKRGHICLTKIIQGSEYFCSLEILKLEICLVTVFRVRKNSYLNDYELLWSWRGGVPSS